MYKRLFLKINSFNYVYVLVWGYKGVQVTWSCSATAVSHPHRETELGLLQEQYSPLPTKSSLQPLTDKHLLGKKLKTTLNKSQGSGTLSKHDRDIMALSLFPIHIKAI